MPTQTYTPLANLTLGSSASTITFSSISQDYRDLVLVVNGSGSNAELWVRLNSSTSSYTGSLVQADGSSAISDRWQAFSYGYSQNVYTNQTMIFQFQDYSQTNKNKSWLWRSSSAGYYVIMGTNRWNSTSAVTSITLSNNTWSAGATFALYGIAA